MIARLALLAFAACSSSYQPPERELATLPPDEPPRDPVPTAAVTVGPWTHTEVAPGETLVGFGVLAGKLVANTSHHERGAALWTLVGKRWEREQLDRSSTQGFLAQGEASVFVRDSPHGESRSVTVRGTQRDDWTICGRLGKVALARRGNVTWTANECERKLAVSRHTDGADSTEALGSVDIDSTYATLVIDDTGLAHVAGIDKFHEARHYMIDAAGPRRVSLGMPVPSGITLARCDGRVVGVFEYRDDYTAAIGRLDGKTWLLGPREKVRVASKFAFGPQCQVFAVALGELLSHGPGGWTEVPGLAIGNFTFEEIAFFDDTIYVGYRHEDGVWVASAKLATSRSAAAPRP
jgi:hypothetical protein